ncbi:hypothetical protein D3C71_801300 [compost metagenome]
MLLEVQHHPFQLALGHLPVGDADACFGHQFGQLTLHAAHAFHIVVQEVQLAAARQLTLERLAQLRVVPRRDEGLDRQPVRRRRGDDRQITQPGHRHVERARNGRGGEREQMHVRAHRFQRFLLAHTETLFFIDDDQAQIAELHVGLQQTVRADDHVDGAFGHLLQLGLDFLGALEARQHFHLERVIGETVAEVAVVLFGQQRGRHQHRHLLATAGGGKGRTHGDFGLAEAHVAADHAVHRLTGLQVAQRGFDGGELIGGFLERETRSEGLVHGAVDIQRQTGAGLTARLDFQQLGSDVAHLLRSLALGLGPLLATERMQRRGFRRRTGVAADQVQLRDRHIQAVALGVLDLKELARHAADVHRDQATVATDTMIFMDDGRAFGQLAQITDDGFRLTPRPARAPRMAGTFGEQLPLGKHRHRRLGDGKAIIQRRNGDGEPGKLSVLGQLLAF